MWESNAVLDYPTDKYILKSPAKQREPLLQFWGQNLKFFLQNTQINTMGKVRPLLDFLMLILQVTIAFILNVIGEQSLF